VEAQILEIQELELSATAFFCSSIPPAHMRNRRPPGACLFLGYRASPAVPLGTRRANAISGGDDDGDGASDGDGAGGGANDDGDDDAPSNGPRWSPPWNLAEPPRRRRDWPATAPGRARLARRASAIRRPQPVPEVSLRSCLFSVGIILCHACREVDRIKPRGSADRKLSRRREREMNTGRAMRLPRHTPTFAEALNAAASRLLKKSPIDARRMGRRRR
jgi:hypothetical protein